jgi:hypothetical protein
MIDDLSISKIPPIHRPEHVARDLFVMGLVHSGHTDAMYIRMVELVSGDSDLGLEKAQGARKAVVVHCLRYWYLGWYPLGLDVLVFEVNIHICKSKDKNQDLNDLELDVDEDRDNYEDMVRMLEGEVHKFGYSDFDLDLDGFLDSDSAHTFPDVLGPCVNSD